MQRGPYGSAPRSLPLYLELVRVFCPVRVADVNAVSQQKIGETVGAYVETAIEGSMWGARRLRG
jgi:hypothetical protein